VSGEVKQGVHSSSQEAAAETARRKIAETDAAMVVARTDILQADGKIQEAQERHQQAGDELEMKRELYRRNPGNVAFRDIEKLENVNAHMVGSPTDAINESPNNAGTKPTVSFRRKKHAGLASQWRSHG
jgi:multidrug resistance efflux pump